MTNDMTLLEELGDALRPEASGPPPALRYRVLNSLVTKEAGRKPRSAAVRLAWGLGAPAAVAAAVTAAMIAGQAANVAGNAPAPPTASRPGPAPVEAPTAAGVLRLAAQHAEGTPALASRPDQFLYVKSVEVQGAKGPKTTAESWLSVDGTRDGLVIQQPGNHRTRLSGCRDGRQSETIDRPDTTPKVPCTPQPAYQPPPPAVPSDPAALLDKLYHPAQRADRYVYFTDRKGAIKLSDDQRVFEELAALADANRSPAAQATVFRAAALVPGVQVRTGARDAAGRAGVAVSRTEAGLREELVFAAGSYRYLGQNLIAAPLDRSAITALPRKGGGGVGSIRLDDGKNRPGDVVSQYAVTRIAVVDRVGQRP